MCISFSRSPSSIRSTGMPVQRETTCAMSEAVTTSSTIAMSALPSPLASSAALSLLLEVRDHAIGELAGAGEIALALRDLELGAGLVELFLELLAALRGAPSRPATSRDSACACSSSSASSASSRSSRVLRRVVGFLLQRLALDLELHDARGRARRAPRACYRPPCAAAPPPRPSGRWPCRAGSGR